MQRPNPLYLEPPSTKCISQNSCEELKPFSLTGMQSSHKIVTNTRSRITHFLRMAASLGAKQYERSSRRFQGCLLHDHEYDWILYRPWLYIFYTIHLNARSRLDLLFLSDDNNVSCIKAQEQNSRPDVSPGQSLRYISITTSTAIEHRKRQIKRRNKIERRLK